MASIDSALEGDSEDTDRLTIERTNACMMNFTLVIVVDADCRWSPYGFCYWMFPAVPVYSGARYPLSFDPRYIPS